MSKSPFTSDKDSQNKPMTIEDLAQVVGSLAQSVSEIAKVQAGTIKPASEENDPLDNFLKNLGSYDDGEPIPDPASDPNSQNSQTQSQPTGDMSQTELLQYVSQEVNDKVAGPLMQEIQTLKLRNQVLAARGSHDDFGAYEPAIKEFAIRNPQLSIEQAYQLVKNEVGPIAGPEKKPDETKPGEEKPGEAPEKKEDDVKTLEEMNSAKETVQDLGSPALDAEKPGISGGAVSPGGDMSLKNAAQAAADEIFK